MGCGNNSGGNKVKEVKLHMHVAWALKYCC